MTDDVTPHVLVGLDDSSGARAALRWAATAASALGVPLRAVTAWHYPADTPMPWTRIVLPSVDQMDRSTRTSAEAIVADELGPDPGDVEIRVAHGPAAGTLAATATADPPDVMVVGSRGLGGFEGLLLGSVTRHLVDHLPCPVVIVRAPEEEGKLSTILVGADGSAGAGAAQRWAARLAAGSGAEVVAVHAAAIGTIDPPSPAVVRLREESTAHLDGDWTEELRQAGAEYRTIVSDGDPRVCIPRVADEVDADLVVVGSRGRGPIVKMMLGSVADHLARYSSRPLAIVPPDRP